MNINLCNKIREYINQWNPCTTDFFPIQLPGFTKEEVFNQVKILEENGVITYKKQKDIAKKDSYATVVIFDEDKYYQICK